MKNVQVLFVVTLEDDVEARYGEGLIVGLVIFKPLAKYFMLGTWTISSDKKRIVSEKQNRKTYWFELYLQGDLMIPLRQLVNTDHVVQNWILSTCFVCQATTKINITLFFLWKILYALFSVTIYLSPKVILVLSCDVEPTFNGHMWLKRKIFNRNFCGQKKV